MSLEKAGSATSQKALTRLWGKHDVSDVLRNYGIILAFIMLFIVLSFASPAFLSVRNLLNILDQSVQIGIIASAMTLAIISGHFDLSAGAIFGLSGSVAALIARTGHPELGILAGISLGFLLGLANGAVIAILRIHSFIATLASGLVIRGLALVLTGGLLVVVRDPVFTVLGQGRVFGVKYTILILLAWFAFMWFLLHRTTFGRYIYAMGGNLEALRLSGVRVDLVRIQIFGLTGLAAGLAGVIFVTRISQGQAEIGNLLELEAIARVVIGGTSIMGGEGAVWRTGVGVLLMRLIGNGFNMLNIAPFYQRIFEGAIILFAVGLDTMAKRRRV